MNTIEFIKALTSAHEAGVIARKNNPELSAILDNHARTFPKIDLDDLESTKTKDLLHIITNQMMLIYDAFNDGASPEK